MESELPPNLTESPAPALADAHLELKHERAKNALLHLARRAEVQPEEADLLAELLKDRLAHYWEAAFEAAVEAAEITEGSQALLALDDALSRSLHDSPDLALASDLYNRLPLDTLALKKTATEVYRQIVRAMEERDRVGLHAV